MADLVPISIREYGRRKGVSDTAIRKHIAAGRITPRSIVKNEGNGRPMIIPAYADEDLTKNYDPHKNQSKKLEDLFSQPPQDNALSLLQKNEAETPSVSVDAGGATLNAARKARAVFEAKLKELEFKERQGAMIDKRRVYKALFEMGQEMRTAILAIPDRIVDEMMASSTRHEAHTILYKALQSELEKFADFASRDIAISR